MCLDIETELDLIDFSGREKSSQHEIKQDYNTSGISEQVIKGVVLALPVYSLL